MRHIWIWVISTRSISISKGTVWLHNGLSARACPKVTQKLIQNENCCKSPQVKRFELKCVIRTQKDKEFCRTSFPRGIKHLWWSNPVTLSSSFFTQFPVRDAHWPIIAGAKEPRACLSEVYRSVQYGRQSYRADLGGQIEDTTCIHPQRTLHNCFYSNKF